MNTKNRNNQSVSEILSSYNRGQGKTDTLTERYDYDSDQFIADGFEPVELSANILKALFVKLFDEQGNKARFLEAVSNDYLCPLHMKIASSPDAKNPLNPSKKVLSSDEYRKNYIKKNLSQSDLDRLISLLDAAEQTTAPDPILSEFRALFETSDEYINYSLIKENEEKDREKLAALESAGMTDIRRIGESKLSGIIKNLTQAGPVLAVFDSLNLSLESMTPTERGGQIIYFSETAEE